jgi:hypothetical protein
MVGAPVRSDRVIVRVCRSASATRDHSHRSTRRASVTGETACTKGSSGLRSGRVQHDSSAIPVDEQSEDDLTDRRLPKRVVVRVGCRKINSARQTSSTRRPSVTVRSISRPGALGPEPAEASRILGSRWSDRRRVDSARLRCRNELGAVCYSEHSSEYAPRLSCTGAESTGGSNRRLAHGRRVRRQGTGQPWNVTQSRREAASVTLELTRAEGSIAAIVCTRARLSVSRAQSARCAIRRSSNVPSTTPTHVSGSTPAPIAHDSCLRERTAGRRARETGHSASALPPESASARLLGRSARARG